MDHWWEILLVWRTHQLLLHAFSLLSLSCVVAGPLFFLRTNLLLLKGGSDVALPFSVALKPLVGLAAETIIAAIREKNERSERKCLQLRKTNIEPNRAKVLVLDTAFHHHWLTRVSVCPGSSQKEGLFTWRDLYLKHLLWKARKNAFFHWFCLFAVLSEREKSASNVWLNVHIVSERLV